MSIILSAPIKSLRGRAIPFSVASEIIRRIPEGKVAVDNQVIAILRTAYEDDKLEYEASLEATDALFNESFPFWRLVTPEGYLTSFDPFHSKDWQRRKLKEEGIEVVADKDGSLKVRNFDSICFDLASAVVLERPL